MEKIEEAIKNLCEPLPDYTIVGGVCKDINTSDANRAIGHATECQFDRLFDDLLRIGRNEGNFWKHLQELVNYHIIDEAKQDKILNQKNNFNDALLEEISKILAENCACKFK